MTDLLEHLRASKTLQQDLEKLTLKELKVIVQQLGICPLGRKKESYIRIIYQHLNRTSWPNVVRRLYTDDKTPT